MLNPGFATKIYLFTGYTDMRKGAGSLALVVGSMQMVSGSDSNKMYVFRGKSADKIKILWWDGQGFCLFYKCFDKGKFIWPTLTLPEHSYQCCLKGLSGGCQNGHSHLNM